MALTWIGEYYQTHICNHYTPFQIYFWGSLIVRCVAFFGMSLIYGIIDLTAPKLPHMFKVQPRKNAPIDKQLFLKTLYVAIRNIVFGLRGYHVESTC